MRLTQVLVNLLNNAIKFTPPGGHIWLIAETMGEQTDAPDQVRIRVRDTGVGIARDLLPKIFDMFMQGDRVPGAVPRRASGVGLTLVRNLVALHGGTVEARSDGAGAGSEFTVTLPIDPKAQAPPRDRRRTRLARRQAAAHPRRGRQRGWPRHARRIS